MKPTMKEIKYESIVDKTSLLYDASDAAKSTNTKSKDFDRVIIPESLHLDEENAELLPGIDDDRIWRDSCDNLKNTAPNKSKEEIFGLALMLASSVMFSSMSLGVKVLSSNPKFRFPSFEMAFARSLLQAILSGSYLLIKKQNPFGPADKKVRTLLLLRGLCGTIGLCLFYWTLTVMSLSDANVVFFTGPPFTALLSYLVLREPISGLDIFAFISSLFAVVLVARPSFIFHDQPSGDSSSAGRVLGATAGIVGAMTSAVTVVTIRRIKKIHNDIPAMVLVFYFGFVASLVTPFFMFTLQKPVLPETPEAWVGIFITSLLAFFGQLLSNKGFLLAPAGKHSCYKFN